MYVAASSHQLGIVALLLESGANATEALVPALWNAGPEFAAFGQVALDYGADVNRAVAEKQPLLNNLIRCGQFRPAFWLLHAAMSG